MRLILSAHFWNRLWIAVRKLATSDLSQTLVILIALSLITGCGRDDVRVYKVAKESQPSAPSSSTEVSQLPPGHPEIEGSSQPHLTWSLPSNWQELPASGMRIASFSAKGKNGKLADVSIIPLVGSAGGILGNVNRWRSQVGQPEATEEEITRMAQTIEIAGQQAQFFEMVGTSQDPESKTNILGAILNRNGTAWFFKMTGSATVVTDQKPIFLDFLKSLKFETSVAQPALPASHPPIGNKPASLSTESKPQWRVPQGWQEAPPTQFLVAQFLISGENGSQAGVNISKTGGGVTANINRWRNQLSLEELSSGEIEKQLQTLAVPDSKAMLIDMRGTDSKSGKKARTIGAVVSLPTGTWYYKLKGDEELVEREKEAFLQFVKSATYP
jgi:hypothetical protein